MKKITIKVNLNNNSYPIIIGKDLLSNTGSEIKKLHNFCWLPALNIKTEKELGCLIIDQWINNFSNYNEKYWTLDVVTMRLIYWISSYEIIFKNSDLIFRSQLS